jgi:hypothetical protein
MHLYTSLLIDGVTLYIYSYNHIYSECELNIYLLLSISSYGWQIHCSPTYIIDFLDLVLCPVAYTLKTIHILGCW